MKWIGALLLISATTWTGFDISYKLNNRPTHIRQLKNALQILEAEILYSQLSLQDAFHTIGKQTPYPISTFFLDLSCQLEKKTTTLYPIWEEQVESLITQSCLKINEKEILLQFGQTLGQHDFEQQQKHITLTIHHLNRELEEARANQSRYSKMAKGLGILCGLFIVLLLL